jgi:hypothetical protein
LVTLYVMKVTLRDAEDGGYILAQLSWSRETAVMQHVLKQPLAPLAASTYSYASLSMGQVGRSLCIKNTSQLTLQLLQLCEVQ